MKLRSLALYCSDDVEKTLLSQSKFDLWINLGHDRSYFCWSSFPLSWGCVFSYSCMLGRISDMRYLFIALYKWGFLCTQYSPHSATLKCDWFITWNTSISGHKQHTVSPSSQYSKASDCDNPIWQWPLPLSLSVWQQCSSTCAGGFQRRVVVCQDENGYPANSCEDRSRPSEQRSCESGPCPQWIYGNWGEVRRTIFWSLEC